MPKRRDSSRYRARLRSKTHKFFPYADLFPFTEVRVFPQLLLILSATSAAAGVDVIPERGRYPLSVNSPYELTTAPLTIDEYQGTSCLARDTDCQAKDRASSPPSARDLHRWTPDHMAYTIVELDILLADIPVEAR